METSDFQYRGPRTSRLMKRIAMAVVLPFLTALGAANAIDAGMPNPPASPTVVKVGVFVADIVDLDELNETFQTELVITAE